MSKLERLEQGLAAGQWVPLSPEADAAPIAQLPPGPGVVVRSGGSSGGSRCCAQPSLHLDRSACLLYTSPSPRDATLSRMPSSA